MTPPMSASAHATDPLQATRQWVETVVLGLELCPFAKREVDAGRVRYVHSRAADADALLADLQAELQRLREEPQIETTLLVHPDLLRSFPAYNDFLDVADALLEALDMVGEFQIASFHPAYQFAGTQPEDAENYSNRSPYPMLHILREASLEAAIAAYRDVDAVPERNIERLRALGTTALREMLAQTLTAPAAGDATLGTPAKPR